MSNPGTNTIFQRAGFICLGGHPHTKVYANFVLTSNPPQYPWICSRCGHKGIDSPKVPEPVESYEQLMRKFYP